MGVFQGDIRSLLQLMLISDHVDSSLGIATRHVSMVKVLTFCDDRTRVSQM